MNAYEHGGGGSYGGGDLSGLDGGDDHYGGAGDDDLDDDLGGYGGSLGGDDDSPLYMDDEPPHKGSSYRLGLRGKSSSKYLLDDEEDMGADADGDNGGDHYEDEEEGDDGGQSDYELRKQSDLRKKSARSVGSSGPKLSSGSLKKYFKRWKRKRPRAAVFRPASETDGNSGDEQNYSYEDEGGAGAGGGDGGDNTDDDQLQNSESGETGESYYPPNASPAKSNMVANIRHTSINSMTRDYQQQQKAKSLTSHSSKPPTSTTDQKTPANTSGEVATSSAEQISQLESPASASAVSSAGESSTKKDEALQKELTKKKKTLKTYLKKIKIGQYFKPYMLGIGGGGSGGGSKGDSSSKEENSSTEKKHHPSNLRKSKKLHKGTSSALTAEQMSAMLGQQQQQQRQQQSLKGAFYQSQMPALIHQHGQLPHGRAVMQPVMVMQAPPPMAAAAAAVHPHHQLHQQLPHPAAITIVEQPGPYGYQVQPAPGGVHPHHPPHHPHHQTMFVDPHSGQLVPGGNPNVAHEIVAEQIVVHQVPINAPPPSGLW